MGPERWRDIERVYHLAREHATGRRAAFLEQACAHDEDLRDEVESLLDRADGGEEYLRAAISEVGFQARELPGMAFVTQDIGETAGSLIGRYYLLRKIGEGGMGEVWTAEQKEPVRRSVALKLVKAGMNTREVIGRFESERQALALMDHPAIAKVFDAGATARGAPYFVMEHIAGIPITTYCDDHRFSIRQRLELFMQVCEGVQHAHQKAIIHRDLKPSNILVIEVDGRAAPKIIDFGVAKALTENLTGDTLLTVAGTLVGTPQYMSPEQANVSSEGIDTRADVYSLGVVLYELLAGVAPLEPRKIPLDEFLRRLRDEDTAKPSTKIRSQDSATLAELSYRRQTEPAALVRQIRGDLDWIALKALEKHRSQRYGSPSDLAADIGRYLKNEAVLAAPPSAAYRYRKFARRYRAAIATVGAFVVVLILAASLSIRQTVRANRLRDRADAEAAAAQAVNNFLQNDLLAQAATNNQAGPDVKADPDLKVRTALDRAAAGIAGKFNRQPEVEAAIRSTIGQTYLDLGLTGQAQVQLERALELERGTLGPENPKTLKTVSLLGRALYVQGKSSKAETLYVQNLEIQRRVLGFEHPDTLASMSNLANIYRRKHLYPQAEALSSNTLEIQKRVLGIDHPNTVASMHNLALDYYEQGKYPQAEALYSEALEIRRRLLGPEHASTLGTMRNLANVYFSQGRYAEAGALHSEALNGRRRILGSEHPDTLNSMHDVAAVYYALGKYAQAEALNRENLEIKSRVLGREDPGTLDSMVSLARTYTPQGKYAQAEALYRRIREIRLRVLGPQHKNTIYCLTDLAVVYRRQGRYGLAETYAAQALAEQRHALGPGHPDTIDSLTELGLDRQLQRKFTESESVAREALASTLKYRSDDWQRFQAEILLGASLAGQKRYAEAEPLLLEGSQKIISRKNRRVVPDPYYLDYAHEWLGPLYRATGQPGKSADRSLAQ